MLSRDELREIFIYDESVPSCLRWRKNGEMYGVITKDGRNIQGYLLGKTQMVARLVWIYHHGSIKNTDAICRYDVCGLNFKINNLHKFTKNERDQCRVFCENEELDKIFYYKDGKLFWKVNNFSGMNNLRWVGKVNDEVCFNISKGGYKTSSLVNKNTPKDFTHHRVIYKLCNPLEDISFLEIDHIDGNRLNNDISNLRSVSRSVNARNMARSKRNTSGKSGVTYDKNKDRWIARWVENGKQRSKSFPVKSFGNLAKQFAYEYRDYMIKELNKIYGENGYTERHGEVL